jgi:hypothetical protein
MRIPYCGQLWLVCRGSHVGVRIFGRVCMFAVAFVAMTCVNCANIVVGIRVRLVITIIFLALIIDYQRNGLESGFWKRTL